MEHLKVCYLRGLLWAMPTNNSLIGIDKVMMKLNMPLNYLLREIDCIYMY